MEKENRRFWQQSELPKQRLKTISESRFKYLLMKFISIFLSSDYGLLPFLIIFGLLLYFIPSIVAFSKNRHNKSAVLVLNIFLGWSFIGWIVALVWAVSNRNPQQIIVNNSQVSTNPSSEDYLDTLNKLHNLKSSGIITEEEFNTQKKKLIK